MIDKNRYEIASWESLSQEQVQSIEQIRKKMEDSVAQIAITFHQDHRQLALDVGVDFIVWVRKGETHE